MANLTINIDVSDEDFKKFCVDNINELPKEQMTELLLKAVEVALIRDTDRPYYDRDASILVNKVQTNYSYKYEPTELLRSVMKQIDTEKYFKDIADEIGQYIRDNYRKLISEYMIATFTSLLFTDANKYQIERNLHNHISEVLNSK